MNDDEDAAADAAAEEDSAKNTAAEDTLAEVVRKGMVSLTRDDEGGVGEDKLIDYVVDHMAVDVDKIKRARAVAAIRSLRGHGATQTDGQLAFDGMDAYDYEPDRLVLNHHTGSIVEQHGARPAAKSAEAERAARNAWLAARQSRRRTTEAAEFNTWAISRLSEGAKVDALTFAAFVQWVRDGRP